MIERRGRYLVVVCCDYEQGQRGANMAHYKCAAKFVSQSALVVVWQQAEGAGYTKLRGKHYCPRHKGGRSASQNDFEQKMLDVYNQRTGDKNG